MGELNIKTSFRGFDFEIHGDDAAVREVFLQIKEDILKSLLSAESPTFNKESKEEMAIEPDELAEVTESNDEPIIEITSLASSQNIAPALVKKARNSRTKIEHYTIQKLVISKDRLRPFIDHYKAYGVKDANQAITVLYYLYQKETSVDNFDLDTTYTLLRTVGEKVPKVLSQTLRDIKNKKNYIDKNDDGAYFLTHIGESYVEHDLKDSVAK